MSEEKPLGIINLLQQIGEQDIRVQFIDTCAVGMNYYKKKGMQITFVTDAVDPKELLSQSPSKLYGIVLWVPRSSAAEVLRKHKESEQTDGKAGAK